MEDLGGKSKSSKAAAFSQAASEHQEPAAAKEMLTPALRANLSKQGYKLIGNIPAVVMYVRHSAVFCGQLGCH